MSIHTHESMKKLILDTRHMRALHLEVDATIVEAVAEGITDAVLAALAVPATGEVEWEYGTRYLGQERVFFESYARRRADEYGEHLIRRRKAGQWEDVPS